MTTAKSQVGPVQPYDALASVYDRWTADSDHSRWAGFVHERLTQAGNVTRVLDVCCGTGRMSRLLAEFGYAVTGLDRSESMLEQARQATSGLELIQVDLPGESPTMPEAFDAAICAFDSVNYFVADQALEELFIFVATAVRSEGLFVFDVNTRHKLEDVFGASHYGDDYGDFAYVWRNRTKAEQRTTEFLITLFTRDGTRFARHEERHTQRWYSHEEIASAATAAGFTVESVTDDYGLGKSTDETQRETWVLQRARADLEPGQ